MALENPKIRAEAIEASEFPSLANLYNVFGVPKTVTNAGVDFDGALPESAYISQVLGR